MNKSYQKWISKTKTRLFFKNLMAKAILVQELLNNSREISKAAFKEPEILSTRIVYGTS